MDREVLTVTVVSKGCGLEHIADVLKNDTEVVLAAIYHFTSILQISPWEL